MKTALYPGSFDPITLGHLDIIKRASKIFDKVLVVVANSASKKHYFSLDERYNMIVKSTQDIPNINIEILNEKGLISDILNEKKIDILIRGLRNSTDFEYEMNIEQFTRNTTDSETIYLSPKAEHIFTSSSLVRNFIQNKKFNNLNKYVHEDIIEDIIVHKDIIEDIINDDIIEGIIIHEDTIETIIIHEDIIK